MSEKNYLWAAIVSCLVAIGLIFCFDDKQSKSPPASAPAELAVAPPPPAEKSVIKPARVPTPVPVATIPIPSVPTVVQPPAVNGILRNVKERARQRVLFFTSKSCAYCELMKRDVIPQSDVQASLVEYNYVVVDCEANPELANKFGVSALPTFVVLDGEDRVQRTSVGYLNPSQFVNWLRGRAAR